ncbi:Adenylate isopentenyltransferase 5, chloroplastic [Musa troglodytarum]|uniref:adenylate dimethylallyltransferase (ADP/ATP-dependent) n=1 Tax=Musa troglodytarum TaxID=320322 RepID=A0A9E7G1E2_9LILI|nr:Adenylate isopentenyltransferase 5, chloroplastic [Musa troglodytarum]
MYIYIYTNTLVCLQRSPVTGRLQVQLLSRELLSSSSGQYRFPMRSFKTRSSPKDKVVLVMGATGTGKSRLAIDLAAYFGGEIVNSDKMQVYDGLDVVTNKVTDEERAGIPHHLIGGIPPDAEFTASDFRREAIRAVESIVRRGRLPIIAGGSNSYIEEMIEGAGREFWRRYECCFLWVDVQLPVLHAFVAERVDCMVERGLVEEVRGLFDPDIVDYSRGIRRAIGVPEMDRYLRAEGTETDEVAKARLLEAALDEIKANTCKLTCCQLQKIHRLSTLSGWNVNKVDATEVFRKKGKEDEAWAAQVACPSIEIVAKFLQQTITEEDQVAEAAAQEAEQFALVTKENRPRLMNETVVLAATTTKAAAALVTAGVDMVKVASTTVAVVGTTV